MKVSQLNSGLYNSLIVTCMYTTSQTYCELKRIEPMGNK